MVGLNKLTNEKNKEYEKLIENENSIEDISHIKTIANGEMRLNNLSEFDFSTSNIYSRDLEKTPADVCFDKVADIEENDDLNKSNETNKMKELKFMPFIKKLSAIAFPAMLFYLFVILMQAINLIFIGIKYQSKEMAESIAASNLYTNCTLFAVTQGLISGIDTLCSNAYALKKYYLMGLYLHRARIVTYAVCTVIVLIHLFTGKYVLGMFNLKPEVKSDAILYLYYILIYVFFDVQSAINLRFLNVIRKAYVSFLILLICIIVHPLWNLIFVMWLDWGIKGSAISFMIGRIILCAMTTGYLWVFNPVPQSNFRINKKCFYGLCDYLKFSLGSALLMCAEWWPFEILTYMSTYMSETDYNVHIYAAQLSSLIFSLPVGISLATTIYISDYIAKCPVYVAKKAAKFASIFAFMSMCLVSFILFFIKGQILKIFTQNHEILDRGEPVIFYLCFTELFDMIQFTFSSILRGLGKQTRASIMTLIQFYIVMMTLAYIFGIHLKMGVYGIWLAILIGYSTASILYFLMLIFLDWEKIKEETCKRLENDHKTSLIEE